MTGAPTVISTVPETQSHRHGRPGRNPTSSSNPTHSSTEDEQAASTWDSPGSGVLHVNVALDLLRRARANSYFHACHADFPKVR
jgi:hypothetical protein